jgi:uncharacterized protein YccT (UPF0319 family)
VSLAARVATTHRQAQEVALLLVDGTEIRGSLHRAPGTRTLDFLNFQAEAFVAMTDATLTSGQGAERVPFVAINKAHILRVIETADAD